MKSNNLPDCLEAEKKMVIPEKQTDEQKMKLLVKATDVPNSFSSKSHSDHCDDCMWNHWQIE